MRTLSAALVLFALASACAPAAPPPPPLAPVPDLAAEERAIREVDARWLKAAQAHDIPGEVANMAADAVFFRAHAEPLVGPAAVQAHFEAELKKNPKVMVSWSSDLITVAASADLAVQTGSYEVTGLGPRGDGKDKGKFITVWKKVAGEWKAVNDVGNTTVPEKP